MEEIWKDIKGYEDLYKICIDGRIKNKKNQYKTPTIGKRGYYVINLWKNNKQTQYYIHQLVAIHFIPNPNNRTEVDHINAIKTDNRIENLRWVTHQENMNNPNTTPLLNYWEGKKQSEETIQKRVAKLRGKKKPYKQCPLRWKKVSQYTLDGEFIKEWDNITEPSKLFKAHHISECCNGKCKSSGGYIWKYKEVA